jgi:hypothetical protein
MPETIFDKDFKHLSVYSKQPIKTERFILIADSSFTRAMLVNERMQMLYNNSNTIATIFGNVANYDHNKYPYTSMIVSPETNKIEIRANY